MKVARSLTSGTLTGLMLLAGSAAEARQVTPAASAPVQSFAELEHLVSPGAAILVTDSAGREFRGTLDDLSATALNLSAEGRVIAFAQADVAVVRQRQRDSLWNGLLIGAAAGTAPAIYWLVVDPNECGGSICMSDLLIGVIPSAAIGLTIDAFIQKKVTLYRRASTSSRMAVVVTPILARHQQGVALTLSLRD